MGKLKQYIWVWEWFASAILIAFAITTLVKEELIYYMFGSIFIIFGLFRVVPLIKTTESKLMKWLSFVEMIVDVVVGSLLFVFSNNQQFDSPLFGYLVGAVLYLRGFMHFLATSLKSEPTTFIGFLTNVILLTVGTIIVFNGGFSLNTFKYVFAVILVICVILLIWRGTVDYRNYRGNLVGTSKTKKMKKQIEEDVNTNPTSDEIKINIIPEENKEERPSVEV